MAREFARALYKSKEWERLRSRCMARPVTLPDGRVCPPYMCERCFERRNRLVPAEICHHIRFVTPLNVHDPSVTLNADNIMRVCRDCHARIHYPNDYRPRVIFGADGKVVDSAD